MPYGKKEVGFSFDHQNHTGANAFNYALDATAGTVSNYYADSSMTDSLGRTKHYTVNASENSYFNIGGNLRRAFKFSNDHQLQFRLEGRFGLSHTPNNINALWIHSLIFTHNDHLSIYYALKDIMAVEAMQSYSYYHSKQDIGQNNVFSSSERATSLSASVNLKTMFSAAASVRLH